MSQIKERKKKMAKKEEIFKDRIPPIQYTKAT